MVFRAIKRLEPRGAELRNQEVDVRQPTSGSASEANSEPSNEGLWGGVGGSRRYCVRRVCVCIYIYTNRCMYVWCMYTCKNV